MCQPCCVDRNLVPQPVPGHVISEFGYRVHQVFVALSRFNEAFGFFSPPNVIIGSFDRFRLQVPGNLLPEFASTLLPIESRFVGYPLQNCD